MKNRRDDTVVGDFEGAPLPRQPLCVVVAKGHTAGRPATISQKQANSVARRKKSITLAKVGK